MSRGGEITLDFGDGTHTFRLRLGELRELQDKTDCGPELLHAKMQAKAWRVDDVRETLRLGLIGGGMKPIEALTLIKRYCGADDNPANWIELKSLAFVILNAALIPTLDNELTDPPEKLDGEAENSDTPNSPTAS
jgi:hypothetical protein